MFCDEHGTVDYCGECVYGPEIEALRQQLAAAQAELARVRELAAKWRAAPQDPDEPLLAMAADEMEAALSQPAEQILSTCPVCGDPDDHEHDSMAAPAPELPLMARDTCTNCGGTGVGGYHVHAPQEDAVEALRCEACDGFGYTPAAQEGEILKGERK